MPGRIPGVIFKLLDENQRQPLTYNKWLGYNKEKPSRQALEWWHQEGHPLRNGFLEANKKFDIWSSDCDPVLSSELPPFTTLDNRLVKDFQIEQLKNVGFRHCMSRMLVIIWKLDNNPVILTMQYHDGTSGGYTEILVARDLDLKDKIEKWIKDDNDKTEKELHSRKTKFKNWFWFHVKYPVHHFFHMELPKLFNKNS